MPENTECLSKSHIRTQLKTIPAKVEVYSDGALAKVSRERVERLCRGCGEVFEVDSYYLTEIKKLKSVAVRSWKEKQRFWKLRYKVNVCTSCRIKALRTCENEIELEGGEVGVCGRVFRAPVEKHSEMVQCPDCGEMVEPGKKAKRSEITRFSENSRRRLMRTLATIRNGVFPKFVTLTFPDSYDQYSEPEHWKVVLKRFEARFRRRFPEGSYIWRLEVVRRKSGIDVGKFKPHFHLLVVGVELHQLREFVTVAWFESVGTCDEKHRKVTGHKKTVQRIISREGIMSYASKTVGRVMSGEIAKEFQAVNGKVGRWHGIAIRENFERFKSELKELVLTDKESVKLLRYFLKKQASSQHWRKCYECGHKYKANKDDKKGGYRCRKCRCETVHIKTPNVFTRAYSSLFCFLDGGWWFDHMPRIVSPANEIRCFRASGRRYDEPFWKFAYHAGWYRPKELVTS